MLALGLLGGAMLLSTVAYVQFGNHNEEKKEKQTSQEKAVHRKKKSPEKVKENSQSGKKTIEPVDIKQLDPAALESLNVLVRNLRQTNNKIIQENKDLSRKVNQLKSNPILPKKQQNSEYQSALPEGMLKLESFSLAAYASQAGSDVANSNHEQVEKLTGKIRFINNDPSVEFTEFIIVINRPNGLVLNLGWESGSFNTGKGERPFTKKIRLEAKVGEPETAMFDIRANAFEKGIYTVKVFHAGKQLLRSFQQLN